MKRRPVWLFELIDLKKAPRIPFDKGRKEQLTNLANEAAREMDRTLVTVCSAILAVSVPFTPQYIVGNPAAHWIVLSWILYAVCLVILVFSLRYDSKQKHVLIRHNNHNDFTAGVYSVLIRFSNWLSQMLFLAATSFLVVFLVITAIGEKA
jgi:hypothetical protein